MSLYADYLKEREGKHVIEDEAGFAVYEFLPEHCYIVDIFVSKPFRREGHASYLANLVAIEAKDRGYSKLLGSVRPSANGSTESLQALLGYGFKLLSADKDAIFFEKNI